MSDTEREQHWRVVSEIEGRFLIQQPHFKSLDDVRAYLDANRNVIVPGERTHVVTDSDARIYPTWRRNRPAEEWSSSSEAPEAVEQRLREIEGRFAARRVLPTAFGALTTDDIAWLITQLRTRSGSDDSERLDAERWRYFRRFLSVEDDTEAGGQILFLNDDSTSMEPTFAPGFDNTVESLVDRARSESSPVSTAQTTTEATDA